MLRLERPPSAAQKSIRKGNKDDTDFRGDLTPSGDLGCVFVTMNTYSHVMPTLLRDAADKMEAILAVGE
jgi:hypothetical protein